jgi:hypothetical protein
MFTSAPAIVTAGPSATDTAPIVAPATVVAKAPATNKGPKGAPTVRLVMGDRQALAILFPQKGHAEKVERFFDAMAPLFSTWLATGGNKTDFQATSSARHGALVAALWAAHATGKGTAKRIGAAWAALAARALSMPGKGFSHDQTGHDTAIEALAVEFMAYFPAPTVRAKADDYETPTAKIARLEAELVALRLECDALRTAAGDKAPASDKAKAKAKAPAPALM